MPRLKVHMHYRVYEPRHGTRTKKPSSWLSNRYWSSSLRMRAQRSIKQVQGTPFRKSIGKKKSQSYASKCSGAFKVVKTIWYHVYDLPPRAAQTCRLDSVPKVLGHGCLQILLRNRHTISRMTWQRLAPSPVPWLIIKTEGKYFSGPLNTVILIPCNKTEQALNLHHESPLWRQRLWQL